MQLTLILADTFRQEVLKSEGKVLPKAQKLDIPLAELSPASRAIVAQENPKLYQDLKLQIPQRWETSVVSVLYQTTDDWEVSFVPTTSADWDRLFSEFVQAKEACNQENQGYRQAQFDRKLTELREQAAKPEGPYSIPWIAEEYANYAGYEEATALVQDLNARNTAAAQRMKEQQLAKEQAEREERRQQAREKKEWIAQYGSPLLRKKIQAGYNCQRQYVQERAAQEFPDYTVDFGDNAEWDERFNPSDEAFVEAEQVGGEVVWLTCPPLAENSEEEDDEWHDGPPFEPFEPSETVVIREYLGRYDLIRMM